MSFASIELPLRLPIQGKQTLKRRLFARIPMSPYLFRRPQFGKRVGIRFPHMKPSKKQVKTRDDEPHNCFV